MLYTTGKACVIVITIVLLTSTEGVKLTCKPDDFKCVVEDWNPTVDGYGFFQHIPNATKSIHLINVQSLYFTSKLCNTIARFVDGLIIYNSPQVQMVQIPAMCSILIVTIKNSGLAFLDFKLNESLKSVIVKNSSLTVIPTTFRDLPNIEYIILEHTDIEAIELTLFYPFQHLKLVSLAHGKLSVMRGLTITIYQCPLDSLKLDHNSLSVVNLNLLATFSSLTLLNLAHNKIEVITGRLDSPKLATLLLNNNRLKVLDLCPWNVLHHLNAVTIAGNYFTRMPLCLNRFQSVSLFSVQFNQITDIEVEQLIQLADLVSINLSFNNISSIPIDRSLYPEKLNRLNLCGNPIRNVSIPGNMIGNIDVSL